MRTGSTASQTRPILNHRSVKTVTPRHQELLEEFEAQLQKLLTLWKELREAQKDTLTLGDKIELQITINEADLARVVRASQKDPAGVARIGPAGISGKGRGRLAAHAVYDEVANLSGQTLEQLEAVALGALSELTTLPTPEDTARAILAEAKKEKPTPKHIKTPSPQAPSEKEKPGESTSQPPESVERSAEVVGSTGVPAEGSGRARVVDKEPPIQYHEAGQPIDEHGDGRMDGVARAPGARPASSMVEEKYGVKAKHKVSGESGFGLVEGDGEE